MNIKKFSSILEQLKTLFEKYYWPRDIFNLILKSIESNNEHEFKKLVVSNEMFGGPGALWETTPDIEYDLRTVHTDAPTYSNDTIMTDRQKFYKLFVDLINELDNQGIKEARIKQVLENLMSMKSME